MTKLELEHAAFAGTPTGGGTYAYLEPFVASGYGLHPPPVNLTMLVDLRRNERYLTDIDATSLRVVNLGHVETEPGVGTAVEQLARWTGLSSERLAYALGASRRSLFNWRQGRQVRPDVEERVRRAFQLVRTVASDRAPASVRSWLEAGDPPSIELMRRGLWEELERRIALQSAPQLAVPLQDEATGLEEPDTYSPQTHALMLQSFTAPRTVTPRDRHWRPRELTGLGDEERDAE